MTVFCLLIGIWICGFIGIGTYIWSIFSENESENQDAKSSNSRGAEKSSRLKIWQRRLSSILVGDSKLLWSEPPTKLEQSASATNYSNENDESGLSKTILQVNASEPVRRNQQKKSEPSSGANDGWALFM